MSAEAARLRSSLETHVRRAGAHLDAAFEKLDAADVQRKGTAIDLVTRLDLEAQEILTSGLERHFPGEPVVAEEGAGPRTSQAESLWLVDPLDGTTNFVHGVPLFAVSVARIASGQLDCGMVYVPRLDELYWSSRGGGAFRNGERLRVSTRTALDEALLATGFPYDIRTHARTNLREWSHLATRCRGLRRCGAAAVDLAWVASGRFDGFWEYRLGPWDLAAGALLVQEAGGRLSTPDGGGEFLWSGDLVATNGHVHAALLAELAAVRCAPEG